MRGQGARIEQRVGDPTLSPKGLRVRHAHRDRRARRADGRGAARRFRSDGAQCVLSSARSRCASRVRRGDALRRGAAHGRPRRRAGGVREDPRIATAEGEIARPGESVRIWPRARRDRARIKVEGPGICYPASAGAISRGGTGRTIVCRAWAWWSVGVNWHDAGGDFVETYLDMSGSYAEMYPYAKLWTLCLVVEPDRRSARRSGTRRPQGGADGGRSARRSGADAHASGARGVRAGPVDPTLPRSSTSWCVHSPQAMSGSPTAFCVATYGSRSSRRRGTCIRTRSSMARSPDRTARRSRCRGRSPTTALPRSRRRHGKDWNFLGVISLRTSDDADREASAHGNPTASSRS